MCPSRYLQHPSHPSRTCEAMSTGSALLDLKLRRSELARASEEVRAKLKHARKVLSNASRPSKRYRQEEAATVVKRATPVPDRPAVLEEFWRQATRGEPCAPEASRARMCEPCTVSEMSSANDASPDSGEGVRGWSKERARNFAREWRLHEWVLKQNETGGQAPCGPQLWAAWRGLAAGANNIPEGLVAAPHGMSRRGKQWVRRWARRWRLLRGRPRPGPALTVEQLRAKVTGRARPTHGSAKIGSMSSVPGTEMAAETRDPGVRTRDSGGRFQGPNSGRQFGPGKTRLVRFFEAMATLQWDRFVASACPPGFSVLRINMDESSFRLWPGVRPGVIARPRLPGRASSRDLEQRVSLRAQRGAVSFVAFVCDDVEVQALLPQFVVANERLVPAECLKGRALDRQTGRLRLLRQKSSWLTAPVLARILGEVGRALQPVASRRHILFSMDACPVHLSHVVLQTLGRLRMHFVPIASHMTRWLQPCDVAVFRALKARQRAEYERQQLLTGRIELPPGEALTVIERAAQAVLRERDWGRAFSLCGLGLTLPTSRRFQSALGPDGCPQVTAELPSLAQLAELLPRRREVPVGDLFAGLLRRGGPRDHAARGGAGSMVGEPCAASMNPPPPAFFDGHTTGAPVACSSSEVAARLHTPAFGIGRRPAPRPLIPRATRLWPWRAAPAPVPPRRS